MKKLSEFIKPFSPLVFGILLVLYYLNWVSVGGATTAMGVIALVLAAYFIVLGVMSIFAKNALSGIGGLLNLIAIVAYPVFMFVIFLISTINAAQRMGPNGWVIIIFSMIVSLGLAILLLLCGLMKDMGGLKKILVPVAMLFILALLLQVLFNIRGDSTVLGNIDLIELVIYLLYSWMLLNAVAGGEEAEKSEPAESQQEDGGDNA